MDIVRRDIVRVDIVRRDIVRVYIVWRDVILMDHCPEEYCPNIILKRYTKTLLNYIYVLLYAIFQKLGQDRKSSDDNLFLFI